MYDLLALAFQTDTTRIATFMTAHDGSNRPYPVIGVPEGHHDLSHHQNKEEKKKKIAGSTSITSPISPTSSRSSRALRKARARCSTTA